MKKIIEGLFLTIVLSTFGYVAAFLGLCLAINLFNLI